MKRTISLFIFLILLLQSTTFAAASLSSSSLISPTPQEIDYPLPYPGILPNHPLYFLKILRDNILLFFRQDSLKNSQIRLILADKHLVMGQILFEEQQFDLGIATLTKGENQLLVAVLNLESWKKSDSLPVGLIDRFELAAKKHEEVIQKLETQIPDKLIQIRLKEVVGITHQTLQKILSLKPK